MNIENLLTVPEAAENAGVSRQTIYYWMNAGVLPFFKKGAQRLIRSDSLLIANDLMAATGKGIKHRKGNRKS